MLYSKLFVFLMIISTSLIAMDEYTVNKKLDKHDVLDVLQNTVIPYLTLQSIGRCAQACKAYKNIFDPGKITNENLPCFSKVESNYHRCTHALSRFVQCNNTKMFKKLWEYHRYIRNYYIILQGNKCNFNVDENMDIYRKYYYNPEVIEKEIIEQLKKAIIHHYSTMVNAIICSKKYNIFELFCKEDVELSFKILCKNLCGNVSFDNLLALLPVEDGEQKNRAVQYIAKYDRLNTLINLLERGYLKVDGEYEHKCTLLHYAALRGCRKLTECLLEMGADVHAVNAWGKQPADYARKFQYEHQVLENSSVYRSHGVLEELKFACSLHQTKECSLPRQRFFCKEEINWLRNSCTYDLEYI